MKTISKSSLQKAMDDREDILLIDVLPKESFSKQHIPDAINIPLKGNDNFVRDVESVAQSKNQRVVVYCASTRCDASQHAAEKLETAGFTQVERFEEGLEGWFGSSSSGQAA